MMKKRYKYKLPLEEEETTSLWEEMINIGPVWFIVMNDNRNGFEDWVE